MFTFISAPEKPVQIERSSFCKLQINPLILTFCWCRIFFLLYLYWLLFFIRFDDNEQQPSQWPQRPPPNYKWAAMPMKRPKWQSTIVWAISFVFSSFIIFNFRFLIHRNRQAATPMKKGPLMITNSYVTQQYHTLTMTTTAAATTSLPPPNHQDNGMEWHLGLCNFFLY